MPAPIDDADRAAIVRRAALGYRQSEIAEAVGVSRNTVRKYLLMTREAVETADDPERTLLAILRGEYDWARSGPVPSFGDHPM